MDESKQDFEAAATDSVDNLTGTVISDLHLLTNRSMATQHMETIRQAANNSAVVVLNGDIFDFKWSIHPSLTMSIEQASRWLRDLADGHTDCRWIVLLGNHDDHIEYQTALDQLAFTCPNLAWHDQLVTIGTKVFLHGDVCHAGGSNRHLETYRAKYRVAPIQTQWQHGLYKAVSRLGVQQVASRLTSKRKAAKRLDQYLHQEMGSEFKRYTDVYFGHVHQPFLDYEYHGRKYHNSGAALIGAKLKPIQFSVNAADLAIIDRQLELTV